MADAYTARGIGKYMLNDYKGAIQDYTIAIKLNPKDRMAYNKRGISKIRIGDKNGGCLDLSKAGELGDASAYDMIRKYCN
ncbi:MAG TPA: hypothetical protein DIT07_12875 [Sphingobacteriaceae bacterium]|nr:hypothetical protein [Sphingobacteriaceae bacterium]